MSLWLLIFSANVVGAVLPPWACDRILKESYGAFGWLEEQKVRALCEYVVIHKLLIAKDSSSAQPLCEEFQNKVEPLWNPKIWDPRKEKTSNQQLSPQDDGDITELEAAQALACHGIRRPPDTHLVYNQQHDQSVARHEIQVEFNANTRGASTPNTAHSSASTSPQVNEKNNVLGRSSTVVSPKTPLLPLLTSSATATATSSTAKPVVGDNMHTNNNNNGHDTNSKSINSFAFNATTHLTDNGHDTTSVMLPGAPDRPGNNNTNNTPALSSARPPTVNTPVPPQSQKAYEGGLWSNLMERLGKRMRIISAGVLNFICDEECLKTSVGTPTLHIRR